MATEINPHPRQWRVYIGAYTDGKSQGVYTAQFDSATGRLSPPELAARTKNPTFVAVHPNGRWLYTVNEMDSFNNEKSGAISAFSRDSANGKLTLLNQRASGGAGPCHLALDTTGRCLFVANYSSGSVASFPIMEDGSLGEAGSIIQHHGSSVNRERQAGPHAHFIRADPANRFVLSCDLGLDKVLIYRLNAPTARLERNDPAFVAVKPGSGPRHLAFHSNGRWVYLINEMGSTLNAFEYDATRGALREFQTISTLPEDFKGQNIAAEVQVHPSGRFLYASNRGHDSLAVFAVDQANGKLSLIERQPAHGKTPRHFTLDPDGRWLIVENQDSNNIVVFKVNPETGRITPTGQELSLGAPVCLVFAEK